MAKGKAKQQEVKRDAPGVVPGSVKLPDGFKAKRLITVPTLTMKEPGQARILTFNEAMRLSNYVDPDPTKAKEKPATISQVTDAESGEVFQFLIPSVVEANLRRDYNGGKLVIEGSGKAQEKSWDETGATHDYVGKTFRIVCEGKRPGKRYRDFSIMEVEAVA